MSDMLRRTYRYRIYPTPAQEEAFRRVSGCARLVFNWGQEQALEIHRRGACVTPGDIMEIRNRIPALKKAKPFLSEVPSHTLQTAIEDLGSAWGRYVSGQNDVPRFRAKQSGDRFRFPDPTQFEVVKRRDEAGRTVAELVAPKFGRRKGDAGAIRLKLHRPMKGRAKSCSIRRIGGMWFASFSVEIALRSRWSCANPALGFAQPEEKAKKRLRKPPRKTQAKAAPRRKPLALARRAGRQAPDTPAMRVLAAKLRVLGVDRNVGQPVVTSDGQVLGEVTFTAAEKSWLRRIDREIARKREALRARNGIAPGGSLKGVRPGANLLKALSRRSRFFAKIARRREHLLHQVSNALLAGADIVVLEDLKLANMTASAKGTAEEPGRNVAQKSGLNGALLDKGHGRLAAMLDYKAAWASRPGQPRKIVLRVDPRHTSQECSVCHHVEAANRKRGRFVCLACGHEDDADLNAAKNIRSRGTGRLAEILGMPVGTRSAGAGTTCQPSAGGSPVEASGGAAVGLPMMEETMTLETVPQMAETAG